LQLPPGTLTLLANFNLIQAPGGVVAPGNGNILGVDPKLGPLQNNGGPTMTMLPQAGSAAINAGDPNFSPPPSTDQRGYPRVNGRLDIGAVEVGPLSGAIGRRLGPVP
jgi:hypothetical protein